MASSSEPAATLDRPFTPLSKVQARRVINSEPIVPPLRNHSPFEVIQRTRMITDIRVTMPMKWATVNVMCRSGRARAAR